MPDTRHRLLLPDPYTMHRGGTLPEVHIAYETWGELSASADNVVLLFTGLSPDSHAASSTADESRGWWEDMVGPGKPVDTDRYFVICVNSLGSCFGSTGPASENSATGRIWAIDFPELSVEDIAATARAALRVMGITHLKTVMGPSLGGMSALAYALMFPGEVDDVALISSAANALPFATAIRSLQRELIRSDPAWLEGRYELGKEPVEGMLLARKLGMISYRSAIEWMQRFTTRRVAEPAEPFGVEFEIEAYLESRAQAFVGHFDANCYMYLSRCMDLFDASQYGDGSLQKAMAGCRLKRALVVGVETDMLFPLHQQKQMADALSMANVDVTYAPLSSIQGHDSFLVDLDRFKPVIREFMSP